MPYVLLSPIRFQGGYPGFPGRREDTIGHLPGPSSAVPGTRLPTTEIDGVPGIAPGTERIESFLCLGHARNG